MSVRGGVAAVASLARYTLKLLSIGSKGSMLTGDFAKVMDKYNLQNPFVRKWFDYLAFALSGLDAAHTQAAAVAYMTLDVSLSDTVMFVCRLIYPNTSSLNANFDLLAVA